MQTEKDKTFKMVFVFYFKKLWKYQWILVLSLLLFDIRVKLFFFKECVRVTQLTFDVEHYLEEVIGHFADWGHRYIAFTNYDLQILDVRYLNILFIIVAYQNADK